jgi:CheY-like chemotaxis protein
MSTDITTRPSILLVDDHQAFRSKLKEMFDECGYQIVEASNGQEAIEAASTECPDLIIMDLNMPIMDGLTASRRIRQIGGRCQSILILAISASGPEMREATIQAGCNDYFNKNDINQMVTAIKHIFKNR